MGRPNPSGETKFSGANGNRENFIFPVQLTTSRVGNLTRSIHILIHPCQRKGLRILEKCYKKRIIGSVACRGDTRGRQ